MSQQLKEKSKGNTIVIKCAWELRKLECSINYNDQSDNRIGGRDRGNFLLKLK